ncbi:hypothetical protein LTS18_004277 [Coniosporium uncinatum]|uniref:Uncharacterized protein n=1 Tax=Coniosporium uncinatum TaxID=93489 RepID=A0ACC3E0B8_9PEZI|nr:hypothetical protein LTS18_004277 [Coniosporium uncinatum]
MSSPAAMFARRAMNSPATRTLIARRGFSSTRTQLASPYHYPEGPRSNIPFNPLTKYFALRFWGFMATGFFAPFGIAGEHFHAPTTSLDTLNTDTMLFFSFSLADEEERLSGSPFDWKALQSTRFPADDLPLTASTWDPSTDSLICAYGPTPNRAFIELRRLSNNGKQSNIAAWDAPCPLPDLDSDQILCIQHFADTATICLVLAGGDIFTVREDPLPGEDLVEIVGSVDSGITAAAWSPDEELLALATRANTFLFMTRDFENVSSVEFKAEDVGLSRGVDVGWGKRETQFKGKRAKSLRDPTVPETVDEGRLSDRDDRSVTISWRGDGAFVAVNCVEQGKRRMIRVFSRDGMLDSVSEPVDGLEGALSWRPAGNLIAGVQRFEDHVDVVFFERNGLRHGQFSLRLTREELGMYGNSISLYWNTDSTVLAVCLQDRAQLWTMGNYHYYLKQEVFAEQEDPSVGLAKLVWHPEKALRLAMLERHKVLSADYAMTVANGPLSPPHDHGMVAVVDGRILKLTPFRLANVPPPMALHDVDTKGNIVDVTFNSTGTRVAVLGSINLSVYDCDLAAKPVPTPVLHNDVSLIDLNLEDSVLRQVAFGPEDIIYVLIRDNVSNRDVVYRYEGDGFNLIPLPEQHEYITSIIPSNEYRTLVAGFSNGSLRDVTRDPSDVPDLPKLPVSCPWMQLAYHNDQPIAFGLAPNGSLYANGRQLMRNCTSFLVTHAHLIVTTTQHLLKFTHLAPTDDLEIPLDTPETDERCRSIERGARLVTAMPTTFAVVLQMPRGNLETIYPRALVLAGIRKSIAALDYKTAFLACRNQRVDMNIIHDHDPKGFMAHIADFISQVRKVEHIDLFLSQLRDEDVSKTMYQDTIKSLQVNGATTMPNGINGVHDAPQTNGVAPPTPRQPPESKVNRVCDAFLDVLSSLGPRYLQNIITANVCKSPPDLEGGLLVIAQLRSSNTDLAERTAEHICFLADVNKLYDHALGLYDLELALLIAQQSQKDPREYLPYMQSLQEMPPLRRRFNIDNDLGRRAKALTSLHKMEAFEELKTYTQKHDLYNSAMSLCKYQPTHLSDLTRLYAHHLTSTNRFKEAGLAYEHLSDYASAVSAYQSAHMWRECLSCALLVPLDSPALSTLATSLAESLTETKDYYAAATIHLDHLSDIPTATRLFCKATHWSEAIRVALLHHRQDLLSEVVDPELVDASGTTTELLADMKTQLLAQIPRLRDLRKKKAENPLAFYDPTTADGDADVPDNVSLAPTDASTSGGTFMTQYTNRTGTVGTNATRRTSKNRRREERKRARGKKGSVYEEEYLVSSVERLVERANETGEEVGRLVEGLVRRGMRERAGAVERGMGEVVGMCEGCVEEVFEVGKDKVGQQGEGEETEGQGRPLGGEGVVWDSLESGVKRVVPVVKRFERLSLLG